MSNALAASGRLILYSLCNWGQDAVWTWGVGVGHSWRVGGDITNDWSYVTHLSSPQVMTNLQADLWLP